MATGIFDYGTANGLLAAMKRVYVDGEPMSQLPEETYYLKAMPRKRVSIGVGLYDDIQTKQNMSFGLRNNGTTDNQDLPESASPEFVAANWDTSRAYLKLTLTGKAANRGLSGDAKASFLRKVSFLRTDIENAYMKDLEFRCLNTPTTSGISGLRGVLDNTGYLAGTSVSFTLDVATNATCRRYKLMQGLQRGMLIDVYNIGTGAKVARIDVKTINVSNNTFTGDLSADIAATANTFYLFNQGDYNQDLNGLGAIVDDGTYTSTLGGVTSSDLWVSTVLGNSGTLQDFQPSQMDQASLVAIKANGGKPVDSWMSFGMKQQFMGYAQRVVQMQTQAGNKMPFKVNPSGDIEQWGPNSSLKTSAFMPAHEIFLIQKEGILIEEQEALQPLSVGESGGKEQFWMRLPSKDTWEAALVHDVQQRTRRRNVHVRLVDLNQPSF